MNQAKSIPFRTGSGVFQLTRERITSAMKEFDVRFRSTGDDSGTLYAVIENGKRYPPKRILELATGVPRSKFYGGKPSNDVFYGLGFHIAETENGEESPDEIGKEQARLAEPVPDVNQLLKNLFTKSWIRLDDDLKKLIDSQYPGVYILAYPDENLLGHPVKEDLGGLTVAEEDIFYIGVSHAGVRKRLRQFIDGLEDCGHHSGAMRFFTTVAKGTPYSNFAERKPFFVASVSVSCTPLKSNRLSSDLQKMGVVAQLEWYVLARVKAQTKQEPWLNKK